MHASICTPALLAFDFLVDQQYQAMDSINKVTVLANSSNNINQSYDYYLQAKTMAEAGLDIGLTPEKVNSIIENAGASIFGKYNFNCS